MRRMGNYVKNRISFFPEGEKVVGRGRGNKDNAAFLTCGEFW